MPSVASTDHGGGARGSYAPTLAWVEWLNNRQLLKPLGYVPPTEYEAEYRRRRQSQGMVA